MSLIRRARPPPQTQDPFVLAKMLARSFNPISEIVVPVEGRADEFPAQQWAIELAAVMALPVRALHVYRSGEDPAFDVFRYMRARAAEWGVTVKSIALQGQDPAQEMIKDLDASDLVIIGTRKLAHGYHLGSVAAALIAGAACPVQVIRIE